MDQNSKVIPTPKNLMECQSDSVGTCMNSDKIMNTFDTLFEQAENYQKTNMDKNSTVIPTPKNLMECQSYSVGKYLESDELMDKFNTVFGQAENYNVDKNSKIIPTPKYLLSLMECQSFSVGKYMKSNRVEDEVEYLEINRAVKKVLRTKKKTRAVARSIEYRMLLKTTQSSQYKLSIRVRSQPLEN
ncbi:hypothetical protein JTB14_020022 [Gonioctena quinquepunctata]|nr:hypothetical protein JTB14_020022 [Gonioctena quinquepunctata]